MSDMNRRDFLKAGATIAAAGVGATLLPAAALAAEAKGPGRIERPNFLFINTDQQRWDTLGCYGAEVAQTPHIDRLAAEGVRFDNCACSHTVCMPARASWLTGQYPRTSGVWHNGVPLDPKSDMIHVRLKEAGYHAALIGKSHIANVWDRKIKHPLYGFDLMLEACGDPWYKDEYFQWLTDQGLFEKYKAEFRRHGHRSGYTRDIDEDLHMNNWMTGHVEKYFQERARDGRPFYLSVGFFDPHHPFDPCDPYASMFDPADMRMPLYKDGELDKMPPHVKRRVRGECRDEKHIRQTIAAYHAMITHIDTMVGRIMKALDRTGLEKNTVVVFTSDHGEMLGDHSILLKGPLFYEGAVHVPLIYRFPRRFGVRGVDAGAASHVDCAPTFAALAGVKGPANMQGVPLFDRDLRLRPKGAFDGTLTEWTDRPSRATEGPYFIARCYRTERWKLVHCPGKDYGELYDRRNDPHEYENKWADPAFAKVRREMTDGLGRFLTKRGIDDSKPYPFRPNDF